jgi:hypothetical protein
MSSYLKSWLEKDLILENLNEYTDEAQIEILSTISPENFSDMIFISEFYLRKKKFRNMFIEKIKKIKNWKVYFDHDCPEEFVDVFFEIADFSFTNRELVIYYLTSYKLPLDIFERYFLKIYQYVLNENNFDRKALRKDSVVFNGVFVVYSREEIVRVLDYLMDRIEKYETQKAQLDNPYTDVLLILIQVVKASKETMQLPLSRLKRLYEVSK